MPGHHLLAASGHGAGQILGARAEQQDALGFGEAVLADGRRAIVAILADGMGGHEGGALAARVAVSAFARRCASGQDLSFTETLQAALQAANRAIGDETASQPGLRDMGCTLLAVAVDRANLHFISVGDSILWLVREGALGRLNADHSMAPLIEEALARGEITEDQAQYQRSGLRSALTGRAIPLIDARSVELRANDALLLASDGILTLSPSQMTAVIAETGAAHPPALVERLLGEVERHAPSDQDNCSIMWVAANSAPAATLPLRRRLLTPAGWTLIGGLALAAIGAGQLLQSGAFDPMGLFAGPNDNKSRSNQAPAVPDERNDAATPGKLRQGERYRTSRPAPNTSPRAQSKAPAAPAPAALPVRPTAPPAKAAEPDKPEGTQASVMVAPATAPSAGADAETDAKRPGTGPSSASQPQLVLDPSVIDQPVPRRKPDQQ